MATMGLMTYLASPEPIALPPGAGRLIPGSGGVTVKASAEQTNGAVAVLEAAGQPYDGPAHIHHQNDELFYVLDGRFQFLLAEQWIDASEGSFVYVPRGTVHAPRLLGPGTGRVLIVFVPGGPEGTFDEVARLVAERGGRLHRDDPVLHAIAAKYDSEFVSLPTEGGEPPH